MKQIIVIIVFFLFAKSVFAQNIDQSKVPAVILNAFQLKYPNADDTRWEKEDNTYQIRYKVNSKSNKLKMDYKGNILEHNQDLYISEIPKVVLEIIRKKVEYFDIQDADKYEKNNRITYHIKFKIDGKPYYFWVNEKGELLKFIKELKNSEVPTSITNFITNKYGELDIDYSKYEEEGNKITYLIKGEINGTDNDFVIDDNINVLKHSKDIKNSEIPTAILNTISLKYKDYDIRDVDLIEEKGNITYILRMRKSKKQVYVTFSKNGKVLNVK